MYATGVPAASVIVSPDACGIGPRSKGTARVAPPSCSTWVGSDRISGKRAARHGSGSPGVEKSVSTGIAGTCAARVISGRAVTGASAAVVVADGVAVHPAMTSPTAHTASTAPLRPIPMRRV